MGSTDTPVSLPNADLSLPLIDISPFLTSSSPSARAATINALRSALLEHGFFYVVQHGVPSSFLDDVISHARTFFTQAPAAEKCRLKRRPAGVGIGDGARGYQVIGENVTQAHRDWHEALDWYAPITLSQGEADGVLAEELEVEGEDEEERVVVQRKAMATNGAGATRLDSGRPSPPYALLHGPNLWPSTPATFRAVYASYIAAMRQLGTAILHAMGAALSLADPATFAAAAQDSFWVLRAIGYPPLSPALAAEGGVSCGEHSDYGCLTLLLADATRGALQVRDQATGDWKAVAPVQDALVVNVGDMVELWTAGLVRSTKHRVVHKGENFRVSVPFFLEPGREVVVEPLPECVREMQRLGRAPLKGKVRYWDHLVGKVGGNFYQPAAKAEGET